MRGTTRDLSDRHEAHLVQVLGGRRTPGSGNQANNPMDGRHNRYTSGLAFAWDGKATLGKSLSISLAMWEKAQEQALGERPMLALRWYLNERLTDQVDLVAVSLDDFVEMRDLAERPTFDPAEIQALIDRLWDEEEVSGFAREQILRALGMGQ